MSEISKEFCLSADEIKPIALGHGACIASDRITVEGEPVGFMYREPPSESVPSDSGWRFFSGTETQDYVDDPNNLSFYDINTIANYDGSIIPFLAAPIGSSYGKDEEGNFVSEPQPEDPDAECPQ